MDRTREMMTTSCSRPWNESMDAISTSGWVGWMRDARSETWELYGETIAIAEAGKFASSCAVRQLRG